MADKRIDVLGVGISVTSIQHAVDTIAGWIQHGHRDYVCVTGMHGIMLSQEDEEVRDIHNRAGLTVPDGAPTLWAGKFCRAPGHDRVRGPDLVLALCERAAHEGWRCFFYGGGSGTAERMAEALVRRFPGLVVAGTFCPPFRPLTQHERGDVIDMINQARSDVVFVGLSTPKQERWMADVVGETIASALIGVGAAFDVHAGQSREAPPWMRPLGLEWAFRTWQEPRRLGPRYLRYGPPFVASILRNPPRLRTMAPPEGPAVVADE